MNLDDYRLGTYFKTPSERKRYSIDYVDWLDDGEELVSATFTPTPAAELAIDGDSISSDGTQLVFFVSGGVDGTEYVLNVLAVTDGGQTKENEIVFEVHELTN